MRSQGIPGPQDQMMDEFMQQPSQLPTGPAPSPWQMEKMRQELQQISQHNSSGSWAAEFEPGLDTAPQRAPGFNPVEFARYQQLGVEGAQQTTSPITNASNGMYRSPVAMNYGMGYMSMQRSYGPTFVPQGTVQQQQQQEQVASAKGKARMVELDDKDWEAQFAQLERTDQDVDAEANAAIERELNDLDRSVNADSFDHPHTLSETDEFGDFESIWRGIQAETAAARSLAEDESFDNIDMDMNWPDFDASPTWEREPKLGEYMFEPQNPFQDCSNPYEEGIQIMDNGGNLSLAALAFEAAVQKDPQHVAAWVRLGSAQAQNEKETPAIRALGEAVKLDPNNLEALMDLAVSYTNEAYETAAYRTLERWLAAKYPELITEPPDPAKEEPSFGITSRSALHEKVTELFLRAAQLSPSGESMDPDVQVGLGVLFYANEEYEKAVDCFESALASTEAGVVNSQQNLHLLWNRLGATLANSGRSEEAIQAYAQALEIRPNFVRARYNLGVSCINIGVLPEAAGHLLGALAMHQVIQKEGREKAREIVSGGDGSEGPSDQELDRLIMQNESTNLYETLRRVFTNMGRRDLTDLVGKGMDVEQFRGEFDF